MSITPEAAGANCAEGGNRIQVGLDDNGNGILDAAEVDAAQTTYVCNGQGDPGTNGQNTLVKTTAEPAGANCAEGGLKIEVGLDANNNGVLDAGEVNAAATSYTCNGSGGFNGLVSTVAEPAGANCATGGTKIQVGIDANDNGILDANEVDATRTSYVCNGAGGLTGPGGISSASTGINLSYVSVTTDPALPIKVRFTLKDDRGYPIDINGVYSLNTTISPVFMMAYVDTDAAGNVLPYVVYTKSSSSSNPVAQPTSYSPRATVPVGTLVENGTGAGDYTYTFPSVSVTPGPQAVAYDATKLGKTHVIWVEAQRQTDLINTTAARSYSVVDKPYWFVPNGVGAPLVRELVSPAKCNGCHRSFQPEGLTAGSFHGARRVDARVCGICHNPARVSNPAAEAAVFVHRIHNSENLQVANHFDGIVVGYPRDIRNCDSCHAGALQGGQSQTVVNIKTCGSCHDYTNFAGTALATCTNPVTRDPVTGIPVPCNHFAGPATDATCGLGCHAPASLATQHKQVALPDPSNALNAGGTNANTNAAYIAATGYVPAGANVITYAIDTVTLVDDATISPNKRPQIRFKLKSNGTDVVFQTAPATEIMANYVGSPSVYFVWSVPQDGVASPADFNASASGYIKNIWNNTATGTGAGILSGPDATGYYTIKLTGVQVPPTAKMLTGGVGYSYNVTSTLPLTQTNVAGFTYTVATKQGGLIVPAPNVYKVATGFTARRAIVDNAKCLTCHSPLGVEPTFHAGQRNDGPTCSWCHNPNRASSGWSSGSRSFIHALHGGRVREVAFNWHALTETAGFFEVEFPGALNECSSCHLPNTYNFRASATIAALPNSLMSTDATGRIGKSISTSPYIVTGLTARSLTAAEPAGANCATGGVVITSGVDVNYNGVLDATEITATRYSCNEAAINGLAAIATEAPGANCAGGGTKVTTGLDTNASGVLDAGEVLATAYTCGTSFDYGAGFSYNAGTGVTTAAAGTNLITSPITNACTGCHDSQIAVDHMRGLGGRFYDLRSNAMAPGAAVEQCLICHGPGKIVDVEVMHR